MGVLLKQYCVIHITQGAFYELRSTQSQVYFVSKRQLFQKEREGNQQYEERASQHTDATQVTFDVRIIGVELSATR